MQKVSFQTVDGVEIFANYFQADSSKAVLLLHQFASSKEAYSVLANLFFEKGFGVLAVDLRGHGESTGKGSLSSPERLTPRDFQNMSLDLKAALDFLKSKKYAEFAIVGASIGANLAISFPSLHAEFKAAVALSPGEEYKSLSPMLAARKTMVPTLLVASREDGYSYSTCEKLDAVMECEHEFYRLENAGHGTHMFALWPGLKAKILDWLPGYFS